jgi:[acyl-carrier-protein] S-malonyltransferase
MPGCSKLAYIFPGQGSKKVGMGKDLFDTFEIVKNIFKQADDTLGFALSKLCFEGPDEILKQTINTQPALVTMSYACLKAAVLSCGENEGHEVAFTAGHSLGEYTALAFAGVLDFPTTVYLARERGRLMQEAGQKAPGSMAAILGMEESLVVALCKETGTWIANINCPGQLVISGPKENIEKAVTLAPAKGAVKAIPLQVSGAFHTPLMQPAADGLSSIIERISFKDPAIPIIANTSAQPLIKAAAIKEELLTQLCNSVQWQKSIELMINQGTSTFIEIGPGKVLTGLVKRINKDVRTLNVGETGELKNIFG